MAKEKLNLEELKEKGLAHLAELLEAEEKDDEDEVELDDEDSDEEDKDDKEDKEVKESAFDQFVAGIELNESDVQKMRDVFGAAVAEKAAEISESKLAELDSKIEAHLAEQEAKNDVHISNYLDFVVEGWVKENQVQIENQVKVELAESFLGKLKGLFEEHSIILESAESIEQITEAKQEVESVRSELTEAVAALADAKKQIFAMQVEKVISELSEGMIETQKIRFADLVGELEIDIKEGIESVETRLKNVKEVFIKESTVESEEKIEDKIVESEIQESEEVNEPITESEKPVVDEKMARYLAAATKGFTALKR